MYDLPRCAGNDAFPLNCKPTGCTPPMQELQESFGGRASAAERTAMALLHEELMTERGTLELVLQAVQGLRLGRSANSG